MSIVNAVGKDQAPLGAACRAPAADRSHVPLLAELEPSLVIRDSYRHVAPNGAFARVLGCTALCRLLPLLEGPGCGSASHRDRIMVGQNHAKKAKP